MTNLWFERLSDFTALKVFIKFLFLIETIRFNFGKCFMFLSATPSVTCNSFIRWFHFFDGGSLPVVFFSLSIFPPFFVEIQISYFHKKVYKAAV